MSELMNVVNQYVGVFTTWLNTMSGGNQILAASMLVVLSGLMFKIKGIPFRIWRWFKIKCIASVKLTTVTNDQNIRGSFHIDLDNLVRFYNDSYWFKFGKRLEEFTPSIFHYNDKLRKNKRLYLNTGSYFFSILNGKLLWVKFNVEEANGNAGANKGDTKLIKSVSANLFCFGLNSFKLLNIIEKINEKYHDKRLCTSTHGRSINRNMRSEETLRKLEDLILSESKKSEIINAFQKFIDSKEDYKLSNLDYRESFLFYGPPGTGKTTLIKYLADIFRLDMAIVSSASIEKDFDVSSYTFRLGSNQLPRIVVIEDVDALKFSKTREDDNEVENVNGLDLSAFLNSLDGIDSPENIIYCFTSNYPEKLDPALTRKGRMNHHILIDLLEVDEINYFIKRRFNKENAFKPNSKYRITIAELGFVFKKHFRSYEDFINELTERLEGKYVEETFIPYKENQK